MTRDDSPQVCAHCGADIPFDEVVWIDPNGDIDMTGEFGDPYHEGCIP